MIRFSITIFLFTFLPINLSHSQAPGLPRDLSARQLKVNAADSNWLLYGANYKAWRYSSLTQIDKNNVMDLAVAWNLNTGLHDAFEASPIVIDGVMYFSTPWNHVYAVNAKTGEQFWHYAHALDYPLAICCGAVNRGVAVGDNKVFMATLDAHLIALDAKTGEKVWDTLVADKSLGYSLTTAPQVVGNKVIVGVSGGDFGVRGFIDAYDVRSGKQVWRFWTVPVPGEPGSETWVGESWKTGGAPAWMPVTYDADSNTIYAGTGNPGPVIDGSERGGANLYSECVVALNADTGQLKWYYQTIPGDVWDLDNVTEMVIDDIVVDGTKRPVLMFAGKNGYFYVLDRISGKFIYALPYCHQINWGKVMPDGTVELDKSKFPRREEWVTVYPGASGGKEWCPAAYDPERKRFFIPTIEVGHRHKVIEQEFRPGLSYWGGSSYPVPNEGYGHIAAIDVEKKNIAWDTRTDFPIVSGISCTASGLVFTGTPDRKMLALDSDTGEILHTVPAASGWHSAPIIFAVNGRQYIAFANGWGGWVTGFDDVSTPKLEALPPDNILYVYTLRDPFSGQRRDEME